MDEFGNQQAHHNDASFPMRWPESASCLNCRGYEIQHDIVANEPRLDLSQSLLPQRSLMFSNEMYSKPALFRRPISWRLGFHAVEQLDANKAGTISPLWQEPRLLLLHLHRIDWECALERHKHYREQDQLGNWEIENKNFGFHYRKCDPAVKNEFVKEFWGAFHTFLCLENPNFDYLSF